MENATKNQENVMSELTQEELVSINGGATITWKIVNGEIIYIIVEEN